MRQPDNDSSSNSSRAASSKKLRGRSLFSPSLFLREEIPVEDIMALESAVMRLDPRKAESFLVELLNTDTGDPNDPGIAARRAKEATRFSARFSDFIPFRFRVDKMPPEEEKWLLVDLMPANEAEAVANFVLRFLRYQINLRRAWDASTPLARKVFLLGPLYETMRDYHALWKVRENIEESLRALAAYANLTSAILHAIHIVDWMRHCPNPDCPAPYFIAMRRSQRYCSEACALPAQREFKRAWWAEHGSEWRKQRGGAAKKRPRPQRSRGKGGK